MNGAISVNPRIESQVHNNPLREVAEGFEQMFLNEMLKEMRKSIPESELIKTSNAEKVYRSMLDYEYSGLMARNSGGIGIADMIETQLREDMNSRVAYKNRSGSSSGVSEATAK